MQVTGAGASFENRYYEMEQAVAWRIIKECFDELGIAVASVDEEHHILNGVISRKGLDGFRALFNGKERYIMASVQVEQPGLVQVIFDIRKKHMQLYQWGHQDSLVKDFYTLFDQKKNQCEHTMICPGCGNRVSNEDPFCPKCGQKLMA